MQEKRVCELQNRNNYKKRTYIWLTKSILRDAKLIPNKKTSLIQIVTSRNAYTFKLIQIKIVN
jgi:hypothetical protein